MINEQFRTPLRRRALVAAGGIAALGLVAACSSAAATTATPVRQGAGGASARVASAAVTVQTTPANGAKNVNPITPITVRATGGRLSSVAMTNPAGKHVTGAYSADHTSWHTTEVLGYGRTYAITAAAGSSTTRTRFTTLTPKHQVSATLARTGGYALSHTTYGIGIVPQVNFDRSISSASARAAVVKALQVSTSPHVAGAWAWYGTQSVHFRPQHYWPAGTKVTVRANVYGHSFGSAGYGASDESVSFTIGRAQLLVAQDNAPKVDKVRVYAGSSTAAKLVRTMNTSMGEHRSEVVNGQRIDFHTMNGTYTVLEHDNPAIMSSASYGLPADAPGGYAPEKIYYATKISTDGIYLHYLNTEYQQNHGQDVSHGCLNLNHPNAVWFFHHSLIGDPVQISGTHGPTIDVAQGGDWSVPWSTWSHGRITSN